MNPQPLARAIAPALLTILLTACGGGGGGGDTGSAAVTAPSADSPAIAPSEAAATADTPTTADAGAPATTASSPDASTDGAPAAPKKLEVFGDLKQYEFNWPAVEGASSYEILMDPDGPEGAAPPISVITDIPANQLQASMLPPAAWHGLEGKATFSVRSCATGRCGPGSPAVNLVGDLTIGYIKGLDPQAGSNFGFAVALSADGNTLAVAAPGWKHASGNKVGRVTVHERRGNKWFEHTFDQVVGSDAAPPYGYSLALSADGRTLAIGHAAGSSQSRVYLCHHLPGADGQEEKWPPCDYAYNTPASQAGMSLSMSANGEVLAIGAPGDGAVYLMAAAYGVDRNDRFIGVVQPGIARFGSQVALSADGNTLVATDVLPGEKPRSGAVYVVRAGTQGWSIDPDQPLPMTTLPFAGSTVAVSGNGDLIAVGIPQQGQVQLFVREGTRYVPSTVVKPRFKGNEFGTSVALSHDGKTLAVGALSKALLGSRFGSSVHLFTHSATLGWQEVKLPSASSGNRGIGAAAINDNLALPNIALSGDGKTLAVGDMDHPSPEKDILRQPLNYAPGGKSYGGVLLY